MDPQLETKTCISAISRADHMGDVNNWLRHLCKSLDLPEPWFCDRLNRMVMDWDADEVADPEEYEDEAHDCRSECRDG